MLHLINSLQHFVMHSLASAWQAFQDVSSLCPTPDQIFPSACTLLFGTCDSQVKEEVEALQTKFLE